MTFVNTGAILLCHATETLCMIRLAGSKSRVSSIYTCYMKSESISFTHYLNVSSVLLTSSVFQVENT